MAHGETYEEFVEKFKPKKTTDDCYTPPAVYEAVKDWAVERFQLQDKNVLRPFFPGGDYQNERYTENDVVIDNPPFSIISQICNFYVDNDIKFFLFAPSLTLFSTSRGNLNYYVSGSEIIYENKARVNTSFVTNLGNKKIVVSSSLHDMIEKAMKTEKKTQMSKYKYPDALLTFSKLDFLAKHGKNIEFDSSEVYWVRCLDSQKELKKAVYGCGFLLSDNATERLKAEQSKPIEQIEQIEPIEQITWSLSDREKQIINNLK